jgi:hypothetical protein
MSQENLTLEHLSAYLPYGVEILQPDVEGRNTFTLDVEGLRIMEVQGFEYFKLKLRPMLDLTKEIKHNGVKFVPIVELLKIKHKGWVIEKLNTRYNEIDFEINNNYAKAHFRFMATLSIDVWLRNIEEEPLWVVQKLLEWHYDIFGLIPKGLAVSIHDVG